MYRGNQSSLLSKQRPHADLAGKQADSGERATALEHLNNVCKTKAWLQDLAAKVSQLFCFCQYLHGATEHKGPRQLCGCLCLLPIGEVWRAGHLAELWIH